MIFCRCVGFVAKCSTRLRIVFRCRQQCIVPALRHHAQQTPRRWFLIAFKNGCLFFIANTGHAHVFRFPMTARWLVGDRRSAEGTCVCALSWGCHLSQCITERYFWSQWAPHRVISRWMMYCCSVVMSREKTMPSVRSTNACRCMRRRACHIVILVAFVDADTPVTWYTDT